jgi:hypothetical protein
LARFIAPEWQLDLPLNSLANRAFANPQSFFAVPHAKIQNTTLAASEGSMKATLNDAVKNGKENGA